MHYLRDSPLANITSQYLSLASGSQGPGVTSSEKKSKQKLALTDKDRKLVDELAAQCEEHDRRLEELQEEVREVKAATSEPQFFVSLSGV